MMELYKFSGRGPNKGGLDATSARSYPIFFVVEAFVSPGWKKQNYKPGLSL